MKGTSLPPTPRDRLGCTYLRYENPDQGTQDRRGNRPTNVRGFYVTPHSNSDVTSETRTLVQNGPVHSCPHHVSRRSPCVLCPRRDGGDDEGVGGRWCRVWRGDVGRTTFTGEKYRTTTVVR